MTNHGSFGKVPFGAVGIDLDETLVTRTVDRYHAPRWRFAAEASVAELLPSFSGINDNEWEVLQGACFGYPQRVAVERLTKVIKIMFNVAVSRHSLTLLARRHLSQLSPDPVELRKGAVGFLEAMHARGVPVGVATSSGDDFASWILRRLGIRRYIKALVTADSLSLEHLKPGPEPWRMLWQLLEVSEKSAVLVVEDDAASLIGGLESHLLARGIFMVDDISIIPHRRCADGFGRHATRLLYRQDFLDLEELSWPRPA